ncbi:hypothetical protein EC957_003892 [Mortierella hygrophila]|uniref:Uncharacterized protein n=1 Tax=Mortierella hygrophila TaxID=979708 RepID=A0A9P6F291_9FUNG|nr:hypothetical protein EC957_003892 [Mortierella hygrophila]
MDVQVRRFIEQAQDFLHNFTEGRTTEEYSGSSFLRSVALSTFLMPIEEMRSHLRNIRDDNFEPTSYTEKGYVLRESVQTDGFRLQVLAFKLNELHTVKYRRLPADKLPSRLTSTVGGTDYFLTKIRNIVLTKQDVAQPWSCDPKSTKILGIDLGQAFVVGVSAIIPTREQPNVGQGQESGPTTMESSLSSAEAGEDEEPTSSSWPKREYQRLHTEREGSGGSSRFVLWKCGLKKQKWNARKTRAEEYRLIADRLLQLVRGSTGAKRVEDNKVVIGVGLGRFPSKIRLSSLHESFQSYFVQKVSV